MGVYIFPKKIASWMQNISPRTQMESSMMGLTFMIIGILGFTIFLIFSDYSIALKILLTINNLFIILFLWSFLITTFQQYTTYLSAIGIIVDEIHENKGLGRLKIITNKHKGGEDGI